MHDKVFAYIAQSQQNESLECHAFLCTKRKVVSIENQTQRGQTVTWTYTREEIPRELKWA